MSDTTKALEGFLVAVLLLTHLIVIVYLAVQYVLARLSIERNAEGSTARSLIQLVIVHQLCLMVGAGAVLICVALKPIFTFHPLIAFAITTVILHYAIEVGNITPRNNQFLLNDALEKRFTQDPTPG